MHENQAQPYPSELGRKQILTLLKDQCQKEISYNKQRKGKNLCLLS